MGGKVRWLMILGGVVVTPLFGYTPTQNVSVSPPAHSRPALDPLSIPGPSQLIPPPPTRASPPRSLAAVGAAVAALADGSGAHVAVVIQELNGGEPLSWSRNANDLFVAASTYKLPILEAEAEGMAAGRLHPNDSICYQESDFEDGPYGDYADGTCFSRLELARRIGQASDNTAAHMLVRDLGGTAALDAYAAVHGATHSAFFDPNLTMAADLARLWVDEAQGGMGGAAAQKILYPLLTRTWYETGIPAGASPPMMVVHKVGMIGSFHHDAALVLGGPHSYVLVVCTEGLGQDQAWALMARISAEVSKYESRP